MRAIRGLAAPPIAWPNELKARGSKAHVDKRGLLPRQQTSFSFPSDPPAAQRANHGEPHPNSLPEAGEP